MGNSKISFEAISEQLNWRYAVKKYDPTKKVSDEDWQKLEEAMTLAPSSYGLQPYKFIVVTDQAMKEHLRPAAYGQPQITDSSHLVVFAYKRAVTANDVARFIDLNAEVRGVGRETLTDFEGMLNASAKRSIDGGYNEVWNSRQAYIALGFLLQSAALLGIDATPMEGFEPAKFNEILGLEDYSAVALAAVGYRAADDSLATLPKVRGRREDLVVRI